MADFTDDPRSAAVSARQYAVDTREHAGAAEVAFNYFQGMMISSAVAIDAMETENARLREALTWISGTGCGCSPPCKCETAEALALWRDEVRARAHAALEHLSSQAPKD